MSADLSLAHVLAAIVPPIIVGKDPIVRHEAPATIAGHAFRLRVIKRGPGYIGAFRCDCGEVEVSPPRMGVEAALTAATALAGKHAVGLHRKRGGR